MLRFGRLGSALVVGLSSFNTFPSASRNLRLDKPTMRDRKPERSAFNIQSRNPAEAA